MSEPKKPAGFLPTLSPFRERDYGRAFLPAALEVVETPPSPTGRALGLIITLFFLVALIWSFFGRVDIMATAPGRLTPIGDTKTIQPLETGMVRAILVQNGQRVKKGDLLVQLDPTQTNADSSRLSQDLARAEIDVARLDALKDAIQTGRPPHVQAPARRAEKLGSGSADLGLRRMGSGSRQGRRTARTDQQGERRRRRGEGADRQDQLVTCRSWRRRKRFITT